MLKVALDKAPCLLSVWEKERCRVERVLLFLLSRARLGQRLPARERPQRKGDGQVVVQSIDKTRVIVLWLSRVRGRWRLVVWVELELLSRAQGRGRGRLVRHRIREQGEIGCILNDW